MENRIKSVVWDMGGVLLRTEDQQPRARLAEEMGIAQSELYRVVFESDTANRAMLGEISESEHWQSIAAHFGLSQDQLVHFQESFWAGDRLDENLIAFIQSLRVNYTTAMLSNAWSDARQAIFERFHMLDAFDVTIFSAEIGLAKPNPKIYLYLLEKLAHDAQHAVFIDDILVNVTAARQLGIHAIQFKSRKQVLEDLAALNVTGQVDLPGDLDEKRKTQA